MTSGIAKALGIPDCDVGPEPTKEELRAEGMPLDDAGRDMTNPFYGRKHTDETKKLRSEQQKARRATDHNHGVKINDRKKYHREYMRKWRKKRAAA